VTAGPIGQGPPAGGWTAADLDEFPPDGHRRERLDPGPELYQETGSWTDVVDVPEPWPISPPVSRLAPRFLRRPDR
jgi:hypothetical protein